MVLDAGMEENGLGERGGGGVSRAAEGGEEALVHSLSKEKLSLDTKN